MYLLDTNCCIRLLNESSGPIHQRFLSFHPTELKLCSVVKAELLFGTRKSPRLEANLQVLKRFFEPLESLLFDDRCAEEYALIRADLTIQGTPIGPNDLMIAAIARRFDATLVTHNVKEFSRVAGLRYEDWE